MNSIDLKKAQESLRWLDGVGFLDFNNNIIEKNKSIFTKRQMVDKEPLGRGLTRFRIRVTTEAVSFRHNIVHSLDVGIHGGYFLSELKRTTNIKGYGLDINPDAMRWLASKDFASTRDKYCMLTFWNTLGCVKNVDGLLAEYTPKFIVMSLPIFTCKEHAMRSPHFKPKKCHWYFTKMGLYDWMGKKGYSLLKVSAEEMKKFDQNNMWTFVFTNLQCKGL